MKAPRPLSEFLAAALILCLPWVALPVGAAEVAATLTGSIVHSDDQSPMPGAKLHVGDPKTGQIFSSNPATDDGSFVLGDLPPSTYALAVESEGGLYVVETPLALAPGTTRTLNLAVSPQPMNQNIGDDEDDDEPWGFWENPLTAALAMLGIATVVGVVIWGDNEGSGRSSSPSAPPG
jgi:hypothetical protein